MKRFIQSIKGTPVGLSKKQVAINFGLLAAVMIATVMIEAAVR